jgi:hypothetical protein
MIRQYLSTAASACAILLALAATSCLSEAASARPWIDMGVKDDIAFDQPVVTFEVFQQLGGGGKGSSLGPSDGDFFFFTNRFILDTGATGIIAMNGAESNLRSNGYVVENTVLEQGVAGFSLLDVSAPYYLEITDSAGAQVALPQTRIMSGQFPDLFLVNGIVGMPAMVGKVVTLDTSVWADIDDIFDLVPMDVHIGNALPAGNGHRYSVPIRAQAFPLDGDPPLPNDAPIPFVEMSVGLGNLNATGSFILDTGAAISFISTDLAKAIGLDSNNDGVLDSSDDQSDGTLPIGGIGGIIEAPLFYIDRFTVPTEQGVDLVWNLDQSLSVLVVDIHPDIDGVLGSDLLTSGWLSFFEEPSPGPAQKVHFDFRQFFANDDLGKIYFDLTPSFDVLQSGTITGDYNGDGVVDAADYNVWRNAYGGAYNPMADGNNDQMIDLEDYALWKSNYGQSAGGSGTGGLYAIPEPSSVLLAMFAAAVLALYRRRHSLAV